MHRRACLLFAALTASSAALADPIKILFVGNSYTFGRVDPVMSYNAANVHDLTAAFNAISSTGSNPFEPHPWGGVPGIFKMFTDESGLSYDVSISARNAATLRGQFLNTANAAELTVRAARSRQARRYIEKSPGRGVWPGVAVVCKSP